VTTLLVVDDEPAIRVVLAEHFTHEGFHVVTAASGVEAFVQAVRWAPRAAILDVVIPRPSGLETLRRLKTLDPGTVVILMSGVPHAVEMLEEAGLSVAGAFVKPVRLDQLGEALARAGVTPTGGPDATPPPRRVRALVVDDDPELRGLLTDYLTDNGFQALGVWDGEEALRRIPEFRPHLVLLDILLPGLSGVDTLRRMRTHLQDACVIMISGLGDAETAQRTLELGAVDYLSKPLDWSRLDALLGIRP